jgi:hypothetical protein
MRLAVGIGVCVWAMGASLCASTIDASMQSSQLLQTGDCLEFLFSGSSYARSAAGLGLATYPGSIHFTFASMPLSVAGQFTAEVQSSDGLISAAFSGPIGWAGGYAQNSGYSGPISAVEGTLSLSNELSQAVFSQSTAELILSYTGPDVLVGMQGNNLRQDLTVSLSNGPLSIGGMVYSVALQNNGSAAVTSGESTNAPEPDSALLLLGAGLGLCVAARVMKSLRPSTTG